MFFTSDLIVKIKEIIKLAVKNQAKITCAESCTGGLLSALFTENSGVSEIFDSGFIVYSNQAKSNLLNIDPKLITKHGAVSSQIAKQMAIKAIANSKATISIAITGIAGPKGGSKLKPVGLVYIASLNQKTQKLTSKKFNFKGSRFEIRKQSLLAAIEMLNRNL
jgi:PncC family amidohydrolase